MTGHYEVILVTLGLLLSFVTYAIRWYNKDFCLPFALLTMGFLSYCAIALLLEVLDLGPKEYHLGGWAPPFGIAYNVDQVNSALVTLTTLIGFINLIANAQLIQRDYHERIGGFLALYILFITGLNGILLTGDLFNLYVLLEIAALSGYAILAMGDPKRAPFGTLNYVFLGTIGACFYLLGVGYLYIKTGTLNMLDFHNILGSYYKLPAIITGFCFIVLGTWIKMGVFPFHIWLPKAYSWAPEPVISVVAPLATKVMAYVFVKMVVYVFGRGFSFYTLSFSDVCLAFGAASIIFGSIYSLRQNNIKRILCFIIVAEMGYFVGGIGLNNLDGLRGTILHIFNDMAMTFCLFLCAGVIVERFGYKLDELRYLLNGAPFHFAMITVGFLSLVGVPPTCGFFSKFYLLKGSIEGKNFIFFVSLIFSSVVNAILLFKLVEISYYNVNHNHSPIKKQKSNLPLMRYLIIFLSVIWILFLGIFTRDIIDLFIDPFIARVPYFGICNL